MARPGILQNLSSREKTLLLVAFIMVVLGGSSVVFIYLDSEIQDLQTRLDEGRDAISTIQERSREYVDSMRRKEALEEAIKGNDSRIQTAIDAIARKVEAATEPDQKTPLGTFDRILRYDAKTTQRPLIFGQKAGKKGAKKETASEFQEVSQPLEYGMVRFLDLVKFWEKVESPERLMYISKIEINRKFGADNIVHGRMTISTFIFQALEAENQGEEESSGKE